jgi:hypothetical protein
MQRSKAHRAFRALADPAPVPATLRAAVLRLAPYQRCTCGSCRACRDNAKWDRIFAKFEVKEHEVRGYRSPLEDL